MAEGILGRIPRRPLNEVPEKGYAPDTCNQQCGPSREWVIDQLFTYHAPDPSQVQFLETIREAAKFFAHIILHNTPPGADQTAAIRKLRECVMTANAAIVLDGLSL